MMSEVKVNPIKRWVLSLAWMLFGSLVGLGGGYYSYLRQMPTFRSKARIQLFSATDAAKQVDSLDESPLLLSKSILEGVSLREELKEVPELMSAPKDSPRVQGTRLGLGRAYARKISEAQDGPVYEVSYSGMTPVSSRQIMVAIVAAIQEEFGGDKVAEWNESVGLLERLVEDSNPRVSELSESLDKVEQELKGVLVEDGGQSATLIQWSNLQRRVEHEYRGQALVQSRLSDMKSLLKMEVSQEELLRSLSESWPEEFQKASMLDGSGEADALKEQLAQLQAQMDALLKIYGEAHPKVTVIRDKMDAVRQEAGVVRLDSMRPAMSMDAVSAWKEADEDARAKLLEKVMVDLTERERQHSEQIAEILGELNELGVKISAEQRRARLRERIVKQLEVAQLTQNTLVTRLKELPDSAPISNRKVVVLEEPQAGQQATPSPIFCLGLGAFAGVGLGGIVAFLAFVAALLRDLE